MTQWLPLHTETAALHSLPLVVAVMFGIVGTALLLGLALAAFVQRQSRPYLLLVGAFGALFGRSVVAGIAVFGYLSPSSHHLLEHGLDILLLSLVIAAVYLARENTQTFDSNI